MKDKETSFTKIIDRNDLSNYTSIDLNTEDLDLVAGDQSELILIKQLLKMMDSISLTSSEFLNSSSLERVLNEPLEEEKSNDNRNDSFMKNLDAEDAKQIVEEDRLKSLLGELKNSHAIHINSSEMERYLNESEENKDDSIDQFIIRDLDLKIVVLSQSELEERLKRLENNEKSSQCLPSNLSFIDRVCNERSEEEKKNNNEPVAKSFALLSSSNSGDGPKR